VAACRYNYYVCNTLRSDAGREDLPAISRASGISEASA